MNYGIGFMTIAEHILDYASTQKQPFRRRELMQFLDAHNVSEASANVLLNRIVEQGLLVKKGFGLYALPEKGKHSFIYKPSNDEQTLAKKIQEKFPFIKFCVWKPSVLIPYMLHIPAIKMMFVDVERVAAESVFNFLQGNAPVMSLLLNPTVQECERYITTDKILIVRILVNEAPITIVNDTPVPTLEKILVDVTDDKELYFTQGAELYTIYNEVFERHNVNRNRLLRYASRRHRKDTILNIINTIES